MNQRRRHPVGAQTCVESQASGRDSAANASIGWSARAIGDAMTTMPALLTDQAFWVNVFFAAEWAVRIAFSGIFAPWSWPLVRPALLASCDRPMAQ
jgi:hypothetical protein